MTEKEIAEHNKRAFAQAKWMQIINLTEWAITWTIGLMIYSKL